MYVLNVQEIMRSESLLARLLSVLLQVKLIFVFSADFCICLQRHCFIGCVVQW